MIAASWCPYSQRLLRRLSHDVETQAALHAHYVPILVDGDDQPTIHARYSGGGWPSIAICTADGRPIWRGTQVEPPRFAELLRAVADQSHDADPEAASIGLDRAPAPTTKEILHAVRDAHDPISRGFALEPEAAGPRFPHFDAIDLLLELGSADDITIALGALSQIMDSLWDEADGGLRRYAAAPDWSDVHGEKPLVDQASLIATLANACAHDSGFCQRGMRAFEWTVDRFALPAGVFAASARPSHPEVPPGWPVPVLDTSISVDWNARLASALFLLAEASGDSELREVALALVRYLLERVHDGRVPHRIREGATHGGSLADLTYLAVAVLDGGFDDEARALVGCALLDQRLADGSLSDVTLDDVACGLLRRPLAPLRENAVFAELCAHLGEVYVETGREILDAVSGAATGAGILASRYALARCRIDQYRGG